MRKVISIQIVEMELNNFHLLVESTFENDSTAYWIIDTGASKTVFDINLKDHILSEHESSEELHAASKTANPIMASSGVLKPISFGKLKITDMSISLLDLSYINELYSNVTDFQVCGLLGSDFLLQHNAVINYKKKLLILH
jgi:hypothetical protein